MTFNCFWDIKNFQLTLILKATYLKKIINKRDEGDNVLGCMTFNCFWAITNFQLTLMTR